MVTDELQHELDWLYATQQFGIKLGLENTERLLTEFLAYPAFQTKVIQVAGTNGKGSTCAFMNSVAQALGLRTGLFTSPHLVRYTERIQVSGVEIPPRELVRLIRAVRELVHDWEKHPTFFELSLVVAMKYFKERECELVILETGMGGRLDATSAVPKDVAVITPVGLDHQQYLGETLTEIAREKGAIMRMGKPCLSAGQAPSVRRELEVIANERRCDLRFVTEPLKGYAVGLAGEHQRENAALALEALFLVHPEMHYDAVAEGLRKVHWQGRFQEITSEHGLVVLDCCHNVHSAQILARQWRERFGSAKMELVFGAARDKNIKGVLEQLLPLTSSVVVYEIDNPRAETRSTLRAFVSELAPGIPCRSADSLQELGSTPLRLVTGSLFLVGEWIEKIQGE